MTRFRGLVRRVARALHPFILVSANGRSWPLDTDKASEIVDRLQEGQSGRELALRIRHASAVRGYAHPDTSELPALLAAISEWIDEAGEEAVGEQVLNLQGAVRAQLSAYD